MFHRGILYSAGVTRGGRGSCPWHCPDNELIILPGSVLNLALQRLLDQHLRLKLVCSQGSGERGRLCNLYLSPQ